jgi:hypothetical protein
MCKEKSAGRLTTKRRRDHFRKRRRPAFVICRGQTRSFKGYSFLNGVAQGATNGWIIRTGNQGALRDCDQHKSPLLCTAYMSAHSQYTPIALLFLCGKRMFSFSGGALDAGVRQAFLDKFSIPPPVTPTVGRLCVASAEGARAASDIRLEHGDSYG